MQRYMVASKDENGRYALGPVELQDLQAAISYRSTIPQEDEPIVLMVLDPNEKPPESRFVALVRQHQWDGYDTDAGERCCWCCGAWRYPAETHHYACGLATFLGEPMEEYG